MDAATIAAIATAVVTIITAFGGASVLVIQAISTMKRELKEDNKKLEVKVEEVRKQTNHLATVAIQQSGERGYAQGTSDERAVGAERAISVAADKQFQDRS